MTIGTNAVKAVLEAWANNFIEDVPAEHRGGQYLIEYNDLHQHLTNLSQGQLTEIMLEVDDELFGA